MNKTDVLKERGKSYGDFTDNSSVAQEMKRAVRKGVEYDLLDSAQKEAIDMICSKISRAVTCNSGHKDNFIDISGYADLVVERL